MCPDHDRASPLGCIVGRAGVEHQGNVPAVIANVPAVTSARWPTP